MSALGKVFCQIKQDFEAARYRLYHKLVNERGYGLPQIRESVFLIGVRGDIEYVYEFLELTHNEGLFLKTYVTLRETIGGLKENPGGYHDEPYSTIYFI